MQVTLLANVTYYLSNEVTVTSLVILLLQVTKGSSIIFSIFTRVQRVLFSITPSPPPKSVLLKMLISIVNCCMYVCVYVTYEIVFKSYCCCFYTVGNADRSITQEVIYMCEFV